MTAADSQPLTGSGWLGHTIFHAIGYSPLCIDRVDKKR